MPNVEFTDILRRFFPDLKPSVSPEGSLYDVVMHLDTLYPGLRRYILDDQGDVRKHVAVAVNGAFVREKGARTIMLDKDANVLILQALSGG